MRNFFSEGTNLSNYTSVCLDASINHTEIAYFLFEQLFLFLSFVVFTSAIPENGANPDDIAAAIETDILFWL